MTHGEQFAMMLFRVLKPMLPVRHLDTPEQCAMFARLDSAKELVYTQILILKVSHY